MRRITAAITIAACAFAALGSGQQAFAQSPGMSLELNRATPNSEGGCQTVFFGENGSPEDFTAVEWRLAVFDADGVFRNLLALPLGAMAPGKRRVVQYNLPFACAELSEIIVNDVAQCTLADGGESTACLAAAVTSRTDIAFGM